MKIQSDYLSFMKSAMDTYDMRGKIISENIANVDTPNYKRKYVKFEDYLSKYNNNSLKGAVTNDMHIEIPNKMDPVPNIVSDNSVSTREDGNNVNIEIEEIDNVKNYVKYSMVTEEISAYFKDMLTGITGGRR